MAQLGRAEATLPVLPPAEASADSTSMTREASGGIAPLAVTATPKLWFQQQQQGWKLSQWIGWVVRTTPSPPSPGPIVRGFPCTAPSVLIPLPPHTSPSVLTPLPPHIAPCELSAPSCS